VETKRGASKFNNVIVRSFSCPQGAQAHEKVLYSYSVSRIEDAEYTDYADERGKIKIRVRVHPRNPCIPRPFLL
jgi:hypothetical protein